MAYSLLFELRPSKSDNLIIGQLHLLKDGEIINTFQATSSIAGRQWLGAWQNRGGLIPPSNILPNKTAYTVTTEAIPMPNIRGVEGNFYQILPFEVPTKGVVRGDFGIHRDANVPGSMGCVVLTTGKGWVAYQNVMSTVKAEGFDKIPLVVSYDTWSPAR